MPTWEGMLSQECPVRMECSVKGDLAELHAESVQVNSRGQRPRNPLGTGSDPEGVEGASTLHSHSH